MLEALQNKEIGWGCIAVKNTQVAKKWIRWEGNKTKMESVMGKMNVDLPQFPLGSFISEKMMEEKDLKYKKMNGV